VARWEGREGAVSPRVRRLPMWVGAGVLGAAAAEKAKVELERLQAMERTLKNGRSEN